MTHKVTAEIKTAKSGVKLMSDATGDAMSPLLCLEASNLHLQLTLDFGSAKRLKSGYEDTGVDVPAPGRL